MSGINEYTINDETKIKHVEELIKKAYKDGFEKDDGFILACEEWEVNEE